MKSYTSEKKIDKKELKIFTSKHSEAFTDWDYLHRMHTDSFDEIPLDHFLDMIGRDYVWYNTFLNNIKIRLSK